ncbi:DUF2470 domain-containing protein [Bacteriovoracaceae bacterium]|nr:DUF2470 domain-containing protein [Bacteriovoracaceae bacterium]
MNEHENLALSLLEEERNGILCTHSIDIPGYPFGSLTPFVLDKDFCPLIYISNIAQHTKNLQSDKKCSIIVLERSKLHEKEKQSFGRYTICANAVLVQKGTREEDEAKEQYFRCFSEAKSYGDTHGFDFYRLEFVKGRYIGGFGKIFWIEKEDWTRKKLFTDEEENEIINHMNKDHQRALKSYLKNFKGINSISEKIKMTSVHQFGCRVEYRGISYYFAFDEVLVDVESARNELVRMSKITTTG